MTTQEWVESKFISDELLAEEFNKRFWKSKFIAEIIEEYIND